MIRKFATQTFKTNVVILYDARIVPTFNPILKTKAVFLYLFVIQAIILFFLFFALITQKIEMSTFLQKI